MYPREYFDTYWRPNLKNEVFVIMSFAPEFGDVWTQAIRPAVEQDTRESPFAHRVDATTLAGSIITEILDGIASCKTRICRCLYLLFGLLGRPKERERDV
jgi:hypothetical protein